MHAARMSSFVERVRCHLVADHKTPPRMSIRKAGKRVILTTAVGERYNAFICPAEDFTLKAAPYVAGMVAQWMRN